MKTVVCSHGFGVGANSRGMFTDIAAAFPDIRFVMFDYNKFDAQGNMTVRPLAEQVKLLEAQLAQFGEPVTVLCHSQGCVVASLASPAKMHDVIFLTPPERVGVEQFERIFGGRPGAKYDREGVSAIPRRDGTITYVGKDYLDSLEATDAQAAYAALAVQRPVTIIRAADDEIIGNTDFTGLKAAIITIPGGHDFAGEFRAGLLETLQKLL